MVKVLKVIDSILQNLLCLQIALCSLFSFGKVVGWKKSILQ